MLTQCAVFVIFFYVEENFTSTWWVILSLRKLLQTAIQWQNRLFLTLESLTFHFRFLDSVLLCCLQTKNACGDVIGACA